mmetsp:Transcript_78531/g.248262  ORF Transcript_78531/g.248262 Transcript_78531/m.248262 type:complete len:293 (-) Transcript_78531:172-1050(-)
MTLATSVTNSLARARTLAASSTTAAASAAEPAAALTSWATSPATAPTAATRASCRALSAEKILSRVLQSVMVFLACSPAMPSVMAKSTTSDTMLALAVAPAPTQAAMPTCPTAVEQAAIAGATAVAIAPPAAPIAAPTATSLMNSASLQLGSLSIFNEPRMPDASRALPATPKGSDMPAVSGAPATQPATTPTPAAVAATQQPPRIHRRKVLQPSSSPSWARSSMSYRRLRSGSSSTRLASEILAVSAPHSSLSRPGFLSGCHRSIKLRYSSFSFSRASPSITENLDSPNSS